ncbi:sugar MFS transporter [Pedobacter nyackensis]|uniref:Glucose/galactose transporter n=1 Tax=Pedobacter nyackensis TaxID=475255 RepID=A0A1W2D2V0_9SPHI|nr:sugar MFS transporter [Pedobacter nyackensis]SMC91860.1 glucose/galactose transporter [Pedobacter nyackensis]
MTEKDISISLRLSRGYARPITIIGGFFFIFGFLTWVNGTLIPYLRIACELEEWQAYLVAFAFYISYTIMAIPSGKLLQRTGMINGMRIGLVVMAFGCALFIPAALMRLYPIFLTGLFIVGAGMTLLQTAVNPYITLLGPPDRAAQRISLMGICNKFAGVIAPIVLSSIILSNADSLMAELQTLSPSQKSLRLDDLAYEVVLPYCGLTVILLIIAYALKYAHLPELQVESSSDITAEKSVTHQQTLNFPLGFMAIFCTVGVEVIAGDTISNYGLYHHLSLDVAKGLTSYTLAAMMFGYVLGSVFIPKFISQESAFLYSNILAIMLAFLVIFLPGTLSLVCLALLGFANALLWPAIWPQALRGLKGKTLSRASAILIMGIAGGAILPLIYGWIAHHSNNQVAYLVIIPCYVFNIYYWLYGKR